MVRQKLGQDPPTYVRSARLETIKYTLMVALAVCREEESYNKITEILTKKIESLRKFTDYNISDAIAGFFARKDIKDSGLNDFPSLVRVFVAEELPELGEIGKQFLDKLLSLGAEHHYVLDTILPLYAEKYPKDYQNLTIEVLQNENLPSTYKDRVIRYCYLNGLTNDKIQKELKKILALYGMDIKESEKHLTSIALFYLTADKQVPEKALMSIVYSEIDRPVKEPKFSQEQGIFYIKFPSANKLLEVAVEALGTLKSEKAGKTLIKLSSVDNINIKRIATKALGNFRSQDVKDRLFQLLTDSDGWVRLIAYLALNRITKIDFKIDWFFTEKKQLVLYVEDYKKKIKETSDK